MVVYQRESYYWPQFFTYVSLERQKDHFKKNLKIMLRSWIKKLAYLFKQQWTQFTFTYLFSQRIYVNSPQTSELLTVNFCTHFVLIPVAKLLVHSKRSVYVSIIAVVWQWQVETSVLAICFLHFYYLLSAYYFFRFFVLFEAK